MEDIVRPRLDSYVWVKFDLRGSISFSRETVIAKGTNVFIHSGTIDRLKCDDYRRELYYNDYQQTWFKSLKDIRKFYKIRKLHDDYYEVI